MIFNVSCVCLFQFSHFMWVLTLQSVWESYAYGYCQVILMIKIKSGTRPLTRLKQHFHVLTIFHVIMWVQCSAVRRTSLARNIIALHVVPPHQGNGELLCDRSEEVWVPRASTSQAQICLSWAWGHQKDRVIDSHMKNLWNLDQFLLSEWLNYDLYEVTHGMGHMHAPAMWKEGFDKVK